MIIVYGKSLPGIHLSLLGKEVIPAQVVEDLGVTFDPRLTFHVHIIKTISFCFLSLAQINRVKHVFNRSTLTTIINALCLVSRFIALPSGPMQRTLISSSPSGPELCSPGHLWFQLI